MNDLVLYTSIRESEEVFCNIAEHNYYAQLHSHQRKTRSTKKKKIDEFYLKILELSQEEDSSSSNEYVPLNPMSSSYDIDDENKAIYKNLSKRFHPDKSKFVYSERVFRYISTHKDELKEIEKFFVSIEKVETHIADYILTLLNV